MNLMNDILDHRDRLIAALRPFCGPGGGADMQAFHDLEDDVVVWENSGEAVTAGDARKAREVIAAVTGCPVSMMNFRRTIQSPGPSPLTDAMIDDLECHTYECSDSVGNALLLAVAELRAARVPLNAAPSVGDVVRECLEAAEIESQSDGTRTTIATLRAAAQTLTAQAAEVERLTGEVAKLKRRTCIEIDDECSSGCIKKKLEFLLQENSDMRRTFGSHPLFAEKEAEIAAANSRASSLTASLETARAALEKSREAFRNHNEWPHHSCVYDFCDILKTISGALAGLPSPPITKIKGEG